MKLRGIIIIKNQNIFMQINTNLHVVMITKTTKKAINMVHKYYNTYFSRIENNIVL